LSIVLGQKVGWNEISFYFSYFFTGAFPLEHENVEKRITSALIKQHHSLQEIYPLSDKKNYL